MNARSLRGGGGGYMGTGESWAHPETESQHGWHVSLGSTISSNKLASLPQPLKVLIYKMDLTHLPPSRLP